MIKSINVPSATSRKAHFEAVKLIAKSPVSENVPSATSRKAHLEAVKLILGK